MRQLLFLLILLQLQANAQHEEPAHFLFGHSLKELLSMSAQSRTYTSSDSLSAIHHFEQSDTMASVIYVRDDIGRVIKTAYSGSLGNKTIRFQYDEKGRVVSQCSTFQSGAKSCLELLYERCENPSLEIISKADGSLDSIRHEYDDQCREVKRLSTGGISHYYRHAGEKEMMEWSIANEDTLSASKKIFDEKGQLIETRSHRSDANGRLKLNSIRSFTYFPNGDLSVVTTFHAIEGVSTEQYVYDDLGRQIMFIERFNRFPKRGEYRIEYQYQLNGKLHTYLEKDEMHQLQASFHHERNSVIMHINDSYNNGNFIESTVRIELTQDGRILNVEKNMK